MLFSPWADVISSGREGLPAQSSAWLPVRWPECMAPRSDNKLDSAVKSSAFASPSNALEPRRPLLWFMVSRTSSRNLACLSRSLARVDHPPLTNSPFPHKESHLHESSTPKRKKKSAGLRLQCVSSTEKKKKQRKISSFSASSDWFLRPVVQQNHNPPKPSKPLSNFASNFANVGPFPT